MQLFLDPSDRRSHTLQLYEQLRDAISDGRLPPSARLQPTRSVAAELSVARSTVTDAYACLTAEGYVEGRRGGGSFVLDGAWLHPEASTRRAVLSPTPVAPAVHPYGQDLTTPARYDLTAGRVDARLFPLTAWRRCTNRALVALGDRYGRYEDPADSADLREALARWATRSRGVAATADQVIVTHGAAHAVDLLSRVLLRPGDVAAVEEPGYPPIAELLRTHGVTVVGVPVDEHGLVVDALPAKARLVHVTPSHQYPLGVVLGRERRLALLRWAAGHGAAIVEDDYDSEFRYTSRPLEPLHRLDRDGRVAYVASFSKTLSPALRIGYTVAPTGLVPAMTAVRQCVDVGPSSIASAALAIFIEEGHLARHVRRARRIYTERHKAAWSALTQLTQPSTALPTQAGLHLALLAPDAPPDDEIIARAARRRLLVSTLRRTYQFGEPQPGIVVGFGALATPDVPRAIATLGQCLRCVEPQKRRSRGAGDENRTRTVSWERDR